MYPCVAQRKCVLSIDHSHHALAREHDNEQVLGGTRGGIQTSSRPTHCREHETSWEGSSYIPMVDRLSQSSRLRPLLRHFFRKPSGGAHDFKQCTCYCEGYQARKCEEKEIEGYNTRTPPSNKACLPVRIWADHLRDYNSSLPPPRERFRKFLCSLCPFLF